MVTQMSKCIQINIGGSWLRGGSLEACILKLKGPEECEYSDDKSRLCNLAIVKQLLDSEHADGGLLKNEASGRPSIVLAPELAFGSPDFNTLDALIKKYEHNLIFVCGFGFSTGSALIEISNKIGVEGIWDIAPHSRKKYNGGWVWVKNDNIVKSYIFLKNYFEQTGEITIPNLTAGESILRLEGDDIVIFPLVCADLISNEESSPREKIIKSIEGTGISHKKLLVTGALLNSKSSSGHWKAAIGDLLEKLKTSNARLMLSNCINPPPIKEEQEDKWRCLSGVFQYREGYKGPSKALPNLRYVDDTKFSGLVLRNTVIGAAFGKLKWTNNASQGLHPFSECIQYVWDRQKLRLCDGNSEADELYRFLLRNKGNMLHDIVDAKEVNKKVANVEIEKLITELHPQSDSETRQLSRDIFQKSLKGIFKSSACCPDSIYKSGDNLARAITVIKLLQMATGAALLPKPPQSEKLEYGQLLSDDGDHEILVWDTNEHSASTLFNKVKEEVVIKGGSARPLTIVCRGKNIGTQPEDGRIRSNRLTDISSPSPAQTGTGLGNVDKDICEANDRIVYWKNQGVIDNIFITTETSEKFKACLKKEVELLK